MRGHRKDNGKEKPVNDPGPSMKKKVSGNGRVLKETGTPDRKKLVQDVQENHTEVAIKKFSNDLENIINIIGDPVFVRDEKFRFTFVNDACCKMLGMERKDIIGKTLAESLPREQMNGFLEVDRRVLESGEEDQCEESVTGKGGKILSIITKKTLYVDDLGNKFIVAVIHEITERKRIQDDLSRITRILMDVGEMAQVGGWELDIPTREVTWMDETCRIHGVEPGYTLKLEEAMNFYTPETRPVLEEALKKAMETGEPYDLESILIPAGSSERIWVRSQGRAVYSGGKIVKLVGTFQNIDRYKRAEDELRERKDILHVITDSAQDAVIMMDQDGDISYWNSAAERILGYTNDESIGRKLHSLIVPSRYQEAHHNAFPVFQQTGQGAAIGKTLDLEAVRKDGKEISVQLSLSAIQLKGAWHAIGILRDVTDRKLAEVALRRSEKNLHEAYKLAKIGAWDWKADTDTVTWTEELYLIAGRDPTLPAPNYAELSTIYTPESWKALESAVERAMGTGEPYRLELELIRPDGIIRIVDAFGGVQHDAGGRITGLHGIVQDITMQKQVEAEIRKKNDEILASNSRLKEIMKNQDRSRMVLLGILEDEQLARRVVRESEEKYRQLVENINDLIYTLDENGVITYVSPVIERISRYRAEELIGTRFERLVYPEDLPGFLKEFADSLGGEIGEYEYRILDRDGSIHFVRTSSRTISKDGRITGVSAVLTDITDRKEAEHQLQELYSNLELLVTERTADLEKANKELESFSYTVSHDLRAPLRHINGFMEMFRREAGESLNEKALHYMEVINDSAKRMGQLIDDLLSFSRMGRSTFNIRPVKLEELADEVIKEYLVEIKNRSVTVNRGTLPEVSGDAAMIRVVLTNLISNAMKFTMKTENPVIEIGSRVENENTVIYVKDNGAGFDMHYADKLFGVFQRLHNDNDFEGTGIGLATVQKIIQRHGGKVWAEGEVGKEACFYFTIPGAECEKN